SVGLPGRYAGPAIETVSCSICSGSGSPQPPNKTAPTTKTTGAYRIVLDSWPMLYAHVVPWGTRTRGARNHVSTWQAWTSDTPRGWDKAGPGSVGVSAAAEAGGVVVIAPVVRDGHEVAAGTVLVPRRVEAADEDGVARPPRLRVP